MRITLIFMGLMLCLTSVSCTSIFLCGYRADMILSTKIEFLKFKHESNWKWVMISYWVRERKTPSILVKREFYIDDLDSIKKLVSTIQPKSISYYSIGVPGMIIFKPDNLDPSATWKMYVSAIGSSLLQRGESSTSVSLDFGDDNGFQEFLIDLCWAHEKTLHEKGWSVGRACIQIDNGCSIRGSDIPFID